MRPNDLELTNSLHLNGAAVEAFFFSQLIDLDIVLYLLCRCAAGKLVMLRLWRSRLTHLSLHSGIFWMCFSR